MKTCYLYNSTSDIKGCYLMYMYFDNLKLPSVYRNLTLIVGGNMSCSVLFVVALCIFMMPLSKCQKLIYVSKSDAAINDISCRSGGESKPCNNLNLALGCLDNNTAVMIDSDYSPYQLDPSHFNTFKNVNAIRLESNGSGQAVVHCTSGAGLSFLEASNITIRNIAFIGCGDVHNSTSKNFNSTETVYLTFRVGLYFLRCANVTMDNVSVSQSIGIAVQFYATHGNNSISSSNFTDNHLTDENGVSGAVYIEFPYCLPDSATSCPPVDSVLVNGTIFIIKNCRFTDNKALSSVFNIPKHVPRNESNYQFGKGGGLSVSFKGSSSTNKIQILNCSFSTNIAKRGGGLYIDFQDQVTDNSVEISGITVEDCSATLGGAISMSYFNFNRKFAGNTISISSSNFTSNKASFWGGATALYVTRQTDSTNQVTLTECIFDSNIGAFGAAAAFSLRYSSPKGQGSLIIPVLDNCRFMNNIDTKVKDSQELAQFGAVYVNFVSVQFKNRVEFVNNSGSGTVAVSAELEFAESTTSVFTENSAVRGAGISLLANAVMSLGRNTTYHFENNTATLHGGAIYSSSIGERTAASPNCFMQYQDFDVPPEDWLVQFTFINNTVDGKKENLANTTTNGYDLLTNNSDNGYDARRLNSIYSQSIIPCLWETIHGNPTFNITLRRQVFCWNKTAWQYSSSECWHEIQTAVADLNIPPILHVTPGNGTKMGISAFDDLENDVTDYLVLFAQSTTPNVGIDNNYHYISSDTIKLLHHENYTNSTYSIHLQTLPQRVIEVQLNVSFNNCTAGLQLRGGRCTFVDDYGSYLRFNSTSGYAEILRGYWIGLQSDGNEVVSYCLYCNGFSNSNSSSGGYIPLTFTTTENSECSVGGRKGFLCSECKDNLSLSIFSIDYHCKEASSVYNGIVWTVFVVVHLIYYVLLAAFIIITNISFTAAPLNSAIIFAQMVTTVVDVTAGGIVNLGGLKTISKAYTCLYGLFNLNLFHPLFHHLTISIPLPVAKILLSLLPLLPLLVVIVCWFVIFCILHQNKDFFFNLQGRGSKFAACCYQFEIKEALRNTLGSFLLLSSTSLLIVLVQLMNHTFLYSSDYKFAGAVFYLDPGSPFDAGHFYFLFPLFVILFVLVPFLLFLICCRYRPDKLNAIQGIVVIDHILEPLQSHFRRYDPETKEPCIEIKENPQIDDDDLDDEREDKLQKKKLYEECLCKLSCGWFRFPACCSGRVYISFKDFHWVPAGFIILRVVLIVMYNYSWNYSIRCTMQLVAVIVTAAFIVIYRPYRSDWINTLDSLIFLDLGLLIALSNYQFHLIEVNHTLSVWVYVIQLILIFIPFLWIILYMGARVFGLINDHWRKRSRLVTQYKHTRVNGEENSEEMVSFNNQMLDNTNL